MKSLFLQQSPRVKMILREVKKTMEDEYGKIVYLVLKVCVFQISSH